MRKERRIRERLGMGPNLTIPITSKPKGMHWKTFHRLRSKAYRYQAINLADMRRFVQKWERMV